MDKISKGLSFLEKRGGPYILILLMVGFLGIFFFFELTKEAEAEAQLASNEGEGQISSEFLIIQGNSLQPAKNPLSLENEIIAIGQIEVVVTGYSSSEDQTDSDPFITAAGTIVQDGVVATNILSFGTKIKLPELFGDKIFVVEDRMNWKKGYHIDIWFPSYFEAKEFGAKRTYIEILKG